jgi:hypothetical protein
VQEQLLGAQRDLALAAVYRRKAECADDLRQELEDCRLENNKLQDQLHLSSERAKSTQEWQKVIQQLQSSLEQTSSLKGALELRLQQSGFENQDLIVQLRESETRWQYAQSQVKLMQAETQRLEQEVRSLKQSQAGSTQLSALNKESALEHRLQQV